MKKVFVGAALLSCSSMVSAQMSVSEIVTVAQQGTAKLRGLGEPKDRCSLGVVVGDGGKVLSAFAGANLAVGDQVTSLNGTLMEGSTADDFSAKLRSIGPADKVAVTVLHGGAATQRVLTCTNAKAVTGPLVAALDSAAKKDFKNCLAQLRAVPLSNPVDWHLQFFTTQCGIQAHAVPREDEANQVHAWMAALIEDAQYVASERSTAAQLVQSSQAYFRGKNRLDLWNDLNSSMSAKPEVVSATPAQPDWAAFKQAAEGAVRARLVDPESAQFEWPYGFIYGTWKPLLQRHLEGYWSCGTVNARNRMGGYAGSSAFVVVLDRSGSVQFVDIGDGRQFDVVAAQCSNSVKLLPPAPPEMSTAASQSVVSVADELAKLAKLRDQGVLTSSEFEAQKAKLLGEAAH